MVYFLNKGYIRLSSFEIKDGNPYSYTLNFFGALSGIGDVIGNDTLADLDYLERYNHEFNVDNVYDGLVSGLQYNNGVMEEYSNLTRDVVYPLISAQNKWFYDSSGVSADSEFKEGFSVNLYNDVSGSPDSAYGINYQQLKPAIKVSNIFKAITEKYASINIKENAFVYSSKVDELYLLMHSRKGTLSQGIGDTELVRETFIVSKDDSSAFDYSSGDGELLPIITYTRYEGSNQARNMTDITFDVNITNPSSGDIAYTMTILDGTQVLATKESSAFTDSLSYNLQTTNLKEWNNLRFEMTADGSISEYTVSMTVLETYSVRSYSASISDSAWSSNTKTSTYPAKANPYSFPQRVEMFRQMPDMKIIDFMSGIFKMFNLVAEVDDVTGEIDLKQVNTFYSTGVERDVTDYVDLYNYDVERLQLYGDIEFKYEDATTFGLLNHNEITQDTFGDLTFSNTEEGGNDSFIFDKGTYNVDIPFERLYFSRLSDEDTGNATTICDGWLVGEDQDPVITKPILFFNINTDVDTAEYKFGMRDKAFFISSYNRGSNSNNSGSLSLNFNAEIDEFTLELNENSLFNSFYKSYVNNTFNKESRNLKAEARFPLSFLTSYSLADKLLIKGSPFIINEITTNLNTGKSQLDLITSFDITADSTDGTLLADVTGVTISTITYFSANVSWEANTESSLAGYNIYLSDDNVTFTLNKSIGVQTSTNIVDLDELTTYYVKVTAVNDESVETNLSSATSVSFTTVAIGDAEAPTQPRNVRTTAITSSTIAIEWDASTDNVGVTGYRVYVDTNPVLPDATNTTYTITGLTTATAYDINVIALDNAGNESAESTTLTVTTL